MFNLQLSCKYSQFSCMVWKMWQHFILESVQIKKRCEDLVISESIQVK